LIALSETIPPPSDVNKDFTFKAKDKDKDWANLEFEDWTKDYGTR